ncbi:MAG: glycosyltransferase [Deltaproteobacteria bacterium]|nr:glycosyltransferase [Deltaproteobacteria bacterium]
MNDPTVSVAVVAIAGARYLERCLSALRAQVNAPVFEVVVVYDPKLEGVLALEHRYPEARITSNAGQRTPLELASRAIQECKGDIIVLTEDHCVPAPDFVSRRLSDLTTQRCAAAGGPVDLEPEASALEFAFYFVDFFRYASPIRAGASPTLTVCNVAYRRRDLEAIDARWRELFHETAVNTALCERFGPLFLGSGGRVTTRRRVSLAGAVKERWAFGRLFGATRLDFSTPGMRRLYRLGAPILPALLFGRMARRALRDEHLSRAFARGLGPVALMVLAWSVGEWLGYLTHTRPDDLTVAQELT